MIDAIPPEILAEQLQITAHIDAITARRLVKFWRRLDPAKMTQEAMIDFMTGAVRQIVMAYGEVAALAAVDFYDMVREVGGWSGKAAVANSAVPPQEQLKRIVRWGIGPLWEETPRPEAALGRLQGATSRLALQPGRRTTYEMVKRDRVRWARVPQGKTCAFCLMLCSRGAVYTSEVSAGQPDALKFHSNCVVGDTLVTGPSSELALRRWYEGEVVVIRTSGGNELTITPNHPVLTRRGWIPAGELYVGQEIAERTCSERQKRLVPDEQDRPTFIEDVWCAFGMNGFVPVPVAAQDFHGDGADTNGDVHIVASDGFLPSEVNLVVREPRGQVLRAGARQSGTHAFSASSPPPQCCLGHGPTSHSLVGCGGLGQTHFGRHLGGPDQTRGTAAPTVNTRISEPAGDDTPRNSILVGQGKFTTTTHILFDQAIRNRAEELRRFPTAGTRYDPTAFETESERLAVYAKLGRDLCERLAGGIAFSSISDLSRVKFEGHVYNLQTVEGWYAANDIIVSNCDCIIVPVGPGQALPAINQELQEEWREATRGQRDQIGAWNEYVAAKYPGAGLMSRTALKTTAKRRAAHH